MVNTKFIEATYPFYTIDSLTEENGQISAAPGRSTIAVPGRADVGGNVPRIAIQDIDNHTSLDGDNALAREVRG